MESVGPSPRTWRTASYVVEAVLLIIVLAIAAVEVAGVYSIVHAGYHPELDRCAHPKSGYDAAVVLGLVALLVSVAATATFGWRLSGGRPNIGWALLATIGAGTVFFVWAVAVLVQGSC
jgi:hypothetical protein